ncbi:ribosome maturation factor RimP [Cellulosimicrobium arenosum]|uniref:ribosome maturation factor RimP n=1 Tax=Cellulosimicrobium arenosum TaxID=2708133 RepID=UPI0030CA238C
MVETEGLVLEDVTVSRAGSRSVVRIVVDLPDDVLGSLDLDTVAEVSRPVSAALDDVGALRGAYTLEVSTPGTDRALTQARHFRRARGRVVRLRLVDGGDVEGRLVDVTTPAPGDAERVDLALDVKDARGRVRSCSVPLADVVRGQVQVELRRALDAALPELDGESTGTTAAGRGTDDEEA